MIARRPSVLRTESSDAIKENVTVNRPIELVSHLQSPLSQGFQKGGVRRRLGVASGFASLVLLVIAAPAAAAPSFSVDLRKDANEVQWVAPSATDGQFRLNFGAGGPGVSETGDLEHDASPAQVEAALNGLDNVGGEGGSVTVEGGAFGAYHVKFGGGTFAHTDVPELTALHGTTPLSGRQHRVLVSTIVRAGVDRGDQSLTYTVDVKNVAPSSLPVVAGDTLTCNPNTWTGSGSPAFAYQWLRNGAAIGGSTGSTYTTVAPADQGAVIQCRLTATNTVADVSNPSDFVGSTRVSAGVVVEPQPATAPPTPPATIALPAQTGTLNGTATRELTCNAGTWTGSPTAFTYQWHRNGAPLGAPVGPTAATSTKLTLTAAEQSPPATFQCSVTGENAGGARTKVSGNRTTASPLTPSPTAPNNENTLYITTANETSGPVTAEIALPAGLETFVYSVAGTNWSCIKEAPTGAEPAKAVCSRTDAASNPLSPGESYETITLQAGLGADAPDHAVAKATVSGGGGGTQSDVDEFDFMPADPFAIDSFDSEVRDFAGNEYTQAGGHPYSASAEFSFTTYRLLGDPLGPPHFLVKRPSKVITDLPRGFVGNALAAPELCPSVEDVLGTTCPARSAVGEINIDIAFGPGLRTAIKMPLFSIEPEYGLPAQFAFAELANINAPFTLSPRLRADDGYAISLEATRAPIFPPLRGVNDATLCSFGANLNGPNDFDSCKAATEPGANPAPLITNPTRCVGQPPTVKVTADSWESPGDFVSRESVDPAPTGCQGVDFIPEVELRPTNKQADSPTGLDVEITMPTEGLLSPTGLSQANLDNAVVTFPEGMSINPAAAHGLTACAPAQVKLGSNAPDECPLSSKVGTIEIDTPIIRETLTGNIYVAAQNDNPFKATLGLYMVFSSPRDGITIKVAGQLKVNPVTGQLTSSFVENPEAPFSRLALKFNSGPRAPLINPPKCGTYAIHSEMSPWSAASPANPTPEEIAAADSTYEVTSGPNGGPCPPGALDPKFDAGLQRATAGSKSPFVLKLDRDDGTQRFTGLDIAMPPGLTAYLKGIPYCSEHVLGGISSAELTGRPELASPACPAASQVGTVQAGAGSGPFPFYAPGRAYLAGPYKGAPLSMVVVTPAVAGPYDFGNVVIRNALYVDPVTARVTVKSDPIPTILHGILLNVKDIRVNVDRPGFTAAPTNCEPSAITALISGESGAAVNRSSRFQVGDCAALGFKPKLAMRLFGGTKRGAHPRLVATLRAREGDANIAGASVALPHSEFLDQAHIRTICTRVQIAAKACPAGAVYGHAEATTPLLDNPLSGPVYLKSSDNPLPDLVAALRGPDHQPIEVVLSGRIDSVNGGIRNTFDVVPDQPVSKFVLSMQGGKKGLLVNSRDICKSVSRVKAKFIAQNGKQINLRPKLQNACKKGAKKTKAEKRRRGH